MNLSPTDRDKLQAYLDALEAVPIPQIVGTRLQAIALQVVMDVEQAIEKAERAMQ